MSCIFDFILPVYFTFVSVRFHLNIDVGGINQTPVLSYMHLTNKDFHSTDLWREKSVACNWTYFLWWEREGSQNFVNKSLVVCVRERVEGGVELTSPALSADGLILWSVPVIYPAAEHQKMYGLGFLFSIIF